MKIDFEKRIIPGISITYKKGLSRAIKDLKKFKINKIALFLEDVEYSDRIKYYSILEKSDIQKIPLVHIYKDYKKTELIFLKKIFKTKYFTIHETDFEFLKNWKGFHKDLFMEFNFNDYIPEKINIDKIGGLCVDLSHFQIAKTKNLKEYKFIKERLSKRKYFKCNHLNGFSKITGYDMHDINSLKNFDYIKDLPKNLFGNIIALEMHDSIKKQLNYKKYLVKMLN